MNNKIKKELPPNYTEFEKQYPNFNGTDFENSMYILKTVNEDCKFSFNYSVINNFIKIQKYFFTLTLNMNKYIESHMDIDEYYNDYIKYKVEDFKKTCINFRKLINNYDKKEKCKNLLESNILKEFPKKYIKNLETQTCFYLCNDNNVICMEFIFNHSYCNFAYLDILKEICESNNVEDIKYKGTHLLFMIGNNSKKDIANCKIINYSDNDLGNSINLCLTDINDIELIENIIYSIFFN